ncbi:MAG: hypothetical protein V8S24_00045 [Gordonibacter pamelaeae]
MTAGRKCDVSGCIDYEYCTGCGSCEVACKEEHGYPVGTWGIRVHDDGPWEVEEARATGTTAAVPTDLCDLCAERTARGASPRACTTAWRTS